ncbi:MAG TPA: hypothetical protein VGC54_12380 [Planctomycetota bacterium]
MTGRAGGLLALAVVEVLAGVGLRNEALCARGRAEAQFRLREDSRQELRVVQVLLADICSPQAVAWRLEQRRRDAELQPEL